MDVSAPLTQLKLLNKNVSENIFQNCSTLSNRRVKTWNSYCFPAIGCVFQLRTGSWQEQIFHVWKGKSPPLHLCQWLPLAASCVAPAEPGQGITVFASTKSCWRLVGHDIVQLLWDRKAISLHPFRVDEGMGVGMATHTSILYWY